jgi:hypothetical protein
MKNIIAAAVATLCVAGVAQAQSTIYVPDFINTELSTGQEYDQLFSVGGNDGNVVITGSATLLGGSTGDVTGELVITSQLSPYGIVAADSFTAGDLNGNYNFQFTNLAAGAYDLGVEFNTTAPTAQTVGFTASVESTYAAPEIDPASAAAGLTLLVGGLLVFRGRRTSTNLTFA